MLWHSANIPNCFLCWSGTSKCTISNTSICLTISTHISLIKWLYIRSTSTKCCSLSIINTTLSWGQNSTSRVTSYWTTCCSNFATRIITIINPICCLSTGRCCSITRTIWYTSEYITARSNTTSTSLCLLIMNNYSIHKIVIWLVLHMEIVDSWC